MQYNLRSLFPAILLSLILLSSAVLSQAGEGTTTTATSTQATINAQQYLTSYLPGTTTGDVTTFYGYYTIEVLNTNSTPYGMLSVNAYTGQIWFHTWHGTFIQEL